MARRLKLLTGLSALAATSALALTGCGEGEGAEGVGHSGNLGDANLPGGESESGEGEGGGSEGAGRASTDKAAFLSGLLMIEGHLHAGTSLYRSGDRAMAATHMKHPRDEVYAGLEPAFAHFDANGFATELTVLAARAADQASNESVLEAFRTVQAAAANAGAATAPSVKDRLMAAALTLTTAGEEFDIGVKDGAIVNAHEYQDAFGFMTATLAMIDQIETASDEERGAVAIARAETVKALSAAPSAAAPATVTTSSEVIYGAAARIDIAARGLSAD